MQDFYINRRSFLKGAAASLALTTLGANAMDIVHPIAPYRVGLIGSGWYGKSDLLRLMQVADIEVVALSDPDRNMLQGAGKIIKERTRSGKSALLYEDYRKMLAAHKFDIIIIGTPDHWHALNAIDALKAGANLYLQKPVSVDILEGESILAAARKYNRTVQVGLQRRSTPHWIEAKTAIIDSGLLGKVSHVEMFCYYHMRFNAQGTKQAIPDYFNYDLWTGPAPQREYIGLPHGRWRSFMEYSNGIVGDMCVHMFDGARWLLNLGWPKRITSTGGVLVQKESAANISDTQTVVFEYENLNCVWQHRTWGTADDPEYPWGMKLFGDKGTLSLSTLQYDFVPVGEGAKKIHKDAIYEREKFPEDLKEERIELHAAPATRKHMLNFLSAMQEKKLPVADIEQGHISTASCILANLSMQTGRSLSYDAVARKLSDHNDGLISRAYRQGWEHPRPENV